MNQTRINALAKEMNQAGLKAMLISPSLELRFLTGFTPMMCERFQALFVTSEACCFYICNQLYYDEILLAYQKDFPIYSWLDGESMTDVVCRCLKDHNLTGQTIGVNSTAQAFNLIDIANACQITFVNGLRTLEEARIIKNDTEIAALKQAALIADKAFEAVLTYIRSGMKEGDVSAFLKNKMLETGGSEPWAIVAAGPNSSYPHYTGDQRVIEKQDILIMDFGCSYQGLCSDMTRTVFLGAITDRQKEIYAIVRQANHAGEQAAVNGAYIPDVDNAARSVIETAGYGKYFFTRLGHGIGHMIHEAPDIKKSNQRKLLPGMAFSVEPGIYLADEFGIRIEDIVLVTEDGNEILNKSDKEIIILCA